MCILGREAVGRAVTRIICMLRAPAADNNCLRVVKNEIIAAAGGSGQKSCGSGQERD